MTAEAVKIRNTLCRKLCDYVHKLKAIKDILHGCYSVILILKYAHIQVITIS